MLEGNDRLANEFELLGDPSEEMGAVINLLDPPNWVSVRLREAANILAGEEHTCSVRQLDGLLNALAERAEVIEREGLYPLSDPRMGMVFAQATIYAAAVVEEDEQLAQIMEDGNDGTA